MVWSGVRRERWWRGHQCGLFRWLNAHVQAGREECLVRTYRRARGTVYSETSREERVSPARRNERCGRLARWSLALAVGAARGSPAGGPGAAVPVPVRVCTCGEGERSWRTAQSRGWPWPLGSSWLCRCCCPRPFCPAESDRSRHRRPKVSAHQLLASPL